MFPFYRVPEVADRDLPEPPAPLLDVAPGDDVRVNGRNGVQYNGVVKATDPWQGLALVQIWDHEVRSLHTAWWEVRYVVKQKATAA